MSEHIIMPEYAETYENEGKTYRVLEEKKDESGEHKKWKIPVGGGVASSAVCFKDLIVFGACDKHIYALNKDTGELAWKFLTGDVVASSLCVVDGIAYVCSDDGFLYALNAVDGSLIWKFRLGPKGTYYSSPRISDGIVYVGGGDSQYFYAVSKGGKLVWRYLTGGRITSSAAIVNDSVLFSCYDGYFYSLSAKNGTKKWKFYTGGISGSPPAVSNEKYEEVWHFSKFATKDAKEITVDNGLIYFGTYNDHVYALDINDGSMVWQFITGAYTSTAPRIVNSAILIGSYDRNLYSLNAEDGRLIWKVTAGGEIDSQVCIHENTAYFGCFDNNIYALPLGGKKPWKMLTGGIVAASPLIAGGTLYVGSFDTFFYAISLRTKEVLWKFQTGFGDVSNVSGIVKIVNDATSRRFTAWKPEVLAPSTQIYSDKHETINTPRHSYLFSNPYKSDTPYAFKKRTPYK